MIFSQNCNYSALKIFMWKSLSRSWFVSLVWGLCWWKKFHVLTAIKRTFLIIDWQNAAGWVCCFSLSSLIATGGHLLMQRQTVFNFQTTSICEIESQKTQDIFFHWNLLKENSSLSQWEWGRIVFSYFSF